MEKNNGEIQMLPTGYVKDLVAEAGCTRMTVYRALRRNAPGEKADKVREIFRTKYLTNK